MRYEAAGIRSSERKPAGYKVGKDIGAADMVVSDRNMKYRRSGKSGAPHIPTQLYF